MFEQASYGSLIRPNLASNSIMTFDSLMRITGQGAVYVRTMNQVSEERRLTCDNATLPFWKKST